MLLLFEFLTPTGQATCSGPPRPPPPADTHAGVRVAHRCPRGPGRGRGGLCRRRQAGSEAGVGPAGGVQADPLHLWGEVRGGGRRGGAPGRWGGGGHRAAECQPWPEGLSARPWPYLLVAPCPPGMGVGGGHTACGVREQVFVELCGLAADRGRPVSSGPPTQALPTCPPGPLTLRGTW